MKKIFGCVFFLACETCVEYLETNPAWERQLDQIDGLEIKRDDMVVNSYDVDLSQRFGKRQPPQMVCFPKTTQHVSEMLKVCNRYNLAVVTVGGGSSLEGNAASYDPFSRPIIVLSTERMNKIYEINKDDMDAIVEPGVGYQYLNEILEPDGLQVGCDPGPGATIGGMIATNASGPSALQYGSMRENIISLEAVLPNGDIIKTGARAPKTSAGYDLTRLLIGSEGTLAIITKATIKLRIIDTKSKTYVAQFETIKEAITFVSNARKQGDTLFKAELLDGEAMAAMRSEMGSEYLRVTTENKPTVIVKGEMENLDNVEIVPSMYESQVWTARKNIYMIMIQKKECQHLTQRIATDTCVPVSNLDKLVSKMQEKVDRAKEETELCASIVGHAGDGNLHMLILIGNDETGNKVGKDISHYVVEQSLRLKGTSTGEHGIGIGKVQYVEKEFGKTTVKLMQKIKKTFDPNQILNPGKKIKHD